MKKLHKRKKNKPTKKNIKATARENLLYYFQFGIKKNFLTKI